MDRDLILRHSKAIRLQQTMLSDFTELINEYCIQKKHPEHFNAVVQALQIPQVGNRIIHLILEYFEKEFHIIKLEKLNIANTGFGDITSEQLINIY